MRPGRDANRGWSPNIHDLALEGSLAVENLNSLIPAVGDVHVALRVDRDPVRRGELAWIRASRPPGFDELTVFIELGDSGVAVSICDINITRGIPRDVGGPLKNVALLACAGSSTTSAATGSRSTTIGTGSGSRPGHGPADSSGDGSPQATSTTRSAGSRPP